MASSLGRSGSKYLSALADPFNENAEGCKIPDANSQPSVAIKAEDAYVQSTAALETLTACAYNPTTSKQQVVGVFATASTWTWTAAFGGGTASGKNAKLISDMDLVRPVAHGIRITCGLAPTATTGFLHVAVFAQPLYNQTTWQYPTTIADLANVPGYKRVPLARLTAEGLSINNRPLDCTAQRYVDVDGPSYASAGTMEFQVPNQWCSIVVVAEGVAASSTVLSVENVLHMECIPRSSSISTPNPAASYNPGALGAASQMLAKTKAAVLDSEKPNQAREAFQNAVKGLSKATGGKVFRPIGRAGGNVKITAPSRNPFQRTIGIPGVNDRMLPSAHDVSMRSL